MTLKVDPRNNHRVPPNHNKISSISTYNKPPLNLT